MKRGKMIVLAVLALAVVGATALVDMLRPRADLPFSSQNTGETGTGAAYRLLEELGFDVSRKTTEHWDGDGVLIALGKNYLPDTQNAMTFANELNYANAYIKDHAVAFVRLMEPYRGQKIVFEEYGRSLSPLFDNSDAASAQPALVPGWLMVLLINLAAGVLFILLFFGQRLGNPEPLRGDFSARRSLESVDAMAVALHKARLYQDSAAGYYAYRARRGSAWDPNNHLKQSLGTIASQADAMELLESIDHSIKEYNHES